MLSVRRIGVCMKGYMLTVPCIGCNQSCRGWKWWLMVMLCGYWNKFEMKWNETVRYGTNALGLWYFMYLVSLGNIEPPEGMEDDWKDPFPFPMRVLALLKWVLLILFQVRQGRFRERIWGLESCWNRDIGLSWCCSSIILNWNIVFTLIGRFSWLCGWMEILIGRTPSSVHQCLSGLDYKCSPTSTR